MSDMRMYNILGIFKGLNNNAKSEQLNESVKQPTVYENIEPQGSIMEAVKSLGEKYMGFKAVEKAAKEGGAKDPAAVAASIGRKKYGKKKFQKAAAAGKKLGEGMDPKPQRSEFKKDVDYFQALAYYYADCAEHASGAKRAEYDRLQAKYQDKVEDLYESAKPDFLDVDKDGNKKETFKKAVKDKKKAVKESLSPNTAKALVDGKLDIYGAVGYGEGVSPEEHAYLQDMYNDIVRSHRLHPDDDFEQIQDIMLDQIEADCCVDEGKYDPAPIDPEAVAKRKRLQALKDKAEDDGDIYAKEKNTPIRKVAGKAYGGSAQPSDSEFGDHDDDLSKTFVNQQDKAMGIKWKKKGFAGAIDPELGEAAPPGAKAERMVKHIKKGYAKDGKLTKREKGIAYATAWKAHNKGQVEEGAEFKDTFKNSTPSWSKAKPAKLKESKVMEETDYFYEKVGKALCEKNPHLDTASGEFVDAVRKEMVAQGIPPNRARNILLMDEDFIMDVATSYGHYAKELAECDAPLNSHLGSTEELDEIARLAGLPTKESTCEGCGMLESSCSCQHESTMGAVAGGLAGAALGKSPAAARVGAAIGDQLTNEEEMGEGNEFSGALAAAKASGAKEFEVDGKKYTVKEDVNVNISAQGEEDVTNLIRKLAGMPVVDKVADAAEEQEVEVAEERDIEHTNTPREETAGLDAAIPSGTDLNRAKKSYSDKPYRGDNPMAVKEEALWKSYEAMINDVKK